MPPPPEWKKDYDPTTSSLASPNLYKFLRSGRHLLDLAATSQVPLLGPPDLISWWFDTPPTLVIYPHSSAQIITRPKNQLTSQAHIYQDHLILLHGVE